MYEDHDQLLIAAVILAGMHATGAQPLSESVTRSLDAAAELRKQHGERVAIRIQADADAELAERIAANAELPIVEAVKPEGVEANAAD